MSVLGWLCFWRLMPSFKRVWFIDLRPRHAIGQIRKYETARRLFDSVLQGLDRNAAKYLSKAQAALTLKIALYWLATAKAKLMRVAFKTRLFHNPIYVWRGASRLVRLF